MLKNKRDPSDKAGSALKKKALVCSTEAAAISIGVHALLIILAGSIVAIKYVQKREASFLGENVNRPKLERRQLQMPVKVKNLQKKSRRPKVTTRMASASQSSFSLPDMMGMGDLGATGFDRSGANRSLSKMGSAGSLGFGMSGVNFFGAKSKGEKMVFILDANKMMVEDRKGGFFTYQFAKDRLIKMIEGMSSATLFNVMAYSGNKTVMFSPKLVPATPENREAVKKWISPLNSSPEVASNLDKLPGVYQEPREYEDSPLDRHYNWSKSIQAAMEQLSDNIFVLCSGYGIPRPSDEAMMEEFDIEDKAKWQESRGWGAEKVAEYERKRAEYQVQAERALEEENKARKADGRPPKIVQDWYNYIFNELKFPPLDRPPALWELIPYGIVDPDWFIEHFELVYEFNYVPQKLPKPAIHIVKLIAEDGTPYELPAGELSSQRLAFLKKIPKAFKGRFEFLKGAKTLEDLLEGNELD